jgi:hypothetical protein
MFPGPGTSSGTPVVNPPIPHHTTPPQHPTDIPPTAAMDLDSLQIAMQTATSTGLSQTIKHINPLKTFHDPEFSVWKSQLEAVLRQEGLWPCVTGGMKDPSPSSSLYNGPYDPFLELRHRRLQASGLIRMAMDLPVAASFDKADYEEPDILWYMLEVMHQRALAGIPLATTALVLGKGR